MKNRSKRCIEIKNRLSPIFTLLGEYYIDRDIVNRWKGDWASLKRYIKDFLIDYINETLENYSPDLPFLDFTLENCDERILIVKADAKFDFSPNVDEFLKEDRKIYGVYGEKGIIEGILPTVSAEKAKEIYPYAKTGGFIALLDINRPRQRILTTLSHEIAHTYAFKNNSEDKPKRIIPDKILEKEAWRHEYEGLMFDLGREILLPRDEFTRYVKEKYPEPSMKNFLEMLYDLGVSRHVLAQRLLKDLKLWDACIFWGTLEGDKIKSRPYDRRKSKSFEWLNLRKEFHDENSEIKKALIKYADIGGVKEYTFYRRGKKLKMDLRCRDIGEKRRDFIGVIYF